MAKEVSRTKNFAAGLIFVQIDDGYGNTVPHTISILNVSDVEADISASILRVEQQADAKAAGFAAAGLA